MAPEKLGEGGFPIACGQSFDQFSIGYHPPSVTP
jgi:hypothetical protein